MTAPRFDQEAENEASNVVPFGDFVLVQVVTIAKFRRPANPRKCSMKRYHVWRWRGTLPPSPSLRCQCGGIEWGPDTRERMVAKLQETR